MILLPAIDMKDGRCVRLQKGDFSTVHQVAEDVRSTAKAFADAGAAWIHMVDLDGARDGDRKNFPEIAKVIAQAGQKVELGGGIKTLEDVTQVLTSGVHRVVIGSAAVSHPEMVQQAVEQWGPQRIAVGIDCMHGKVRTAGWEQETGVDYLTFAKQMQALGVQTIVFTDIETDGMLEGPSFAQLEALQRAVSCRIIASGGVTTIEDVIRLRDMGLYGAIIGKAYYAGTLDLAQAIREAGEQC